jgi:hypothetical protein
MKNEISSTPQPTFSISSTNSYEEDSDDRAAKNTACKKYRCRVILGLTTIVILISVLSVVAFLVTRRHPSASTVTSNNQSNSIRGNSTDKKNRTNHKHKTQNPKPTITLSDQVETVIRSAAWWWDGSESDNPDSYHSKAMEWLKQDIDFQNFTHKEKIASKTNEKLHRRWTTRYALACLYYSTNAVRHVYTQLDIGLGIIHPWKNNTNWLSHHTSECQWFGITCEQETKPSRRLGNTLSNGGGGDDDDDDDTHDQDSHLVVTKVELPNNRLTGSFPREVTLLSNLKTLDLYRNWIWNSGKEGNSWLGYLTSMEYL